MMIWLDLLLALVVAVVLGVLAVWAVGWRHPRSSGAWASLVFLVLVLVPAIWAGAAWSTDYGPALGDTYWLPTLAVGLFIVMIILAVTATPPPPQVTQSDVASGPENPGPGAAVFGLFFWLLLVVALIVIAAAYLSA